MTLFISLIYFQGLRLIAEQRLVHLGWRSSLVLLPRVGSCVHRRTAYAMAASGWYFTVAIIFIRCPWVIVISNCDFIKVRSFLRQSWLFKMYYLVKKTQNNHVMDYPCFIIHIDFVTKLCMNHEFPFCISKDVSVNL